LPYSGIARLNGSKSIIQRYLLIASVQPMQITLAPGSVCEDVLELAAALESLRIKVSVTEKEIGIDSENCNLSAGSEVRFKASATALRFWLARSVICTDLTSILISEQLHKRPLQPFLDALSDMGCLVQQDTSDVPDYPYKITITPPAIIPSELVLEADISSQFISGLMMIAPLVEQGLVMRFKQDAVSYYYLELTRYVMDSLGVNTFVEPRRIVIAGKAKYLIKNCQIQIEPELSGGAFYLALAAFSRDGIGIKTTPYPRQQPDWEIWSIVKEMGAKLMSNDTLVMLKAGELHGIELDMKHYPDLVPLVAVLALFADSPSKHYNISRIKYKESDRLHGILKAFNQIGADYEFDGTNLVIYPLQNEIKEVMLDTQGDHRLVIAFTLLQLHYPQINLSETESVAKSFPDFYNILKTLKIAD